MIQWRKALQFMRRLLKTLTFAVILPGALRHSLQDRLSKGTSAGKGRSEEIYLKLRTSTGEFLRFFFLLISFLLFEMLLCVIILNIDEESLAFCG